MMNRTVIFWITTAAALTAGCSSGGVRERLTAADRSLDEGADARSVITLLDSIDSCSTLRGADRALMSLVRLHAVLEADAPLPNDSAAVTVADYYGKHAPGSYREAQACYMRGFVLENRQGRTDEAIGWLKRAETLAEDMDSTALCLKIYTQMNNINNKTGNNRMALGYAMKALERGEAAGDSTAVAHALHSAGTACYLLGMKDSAYMYTKRSIPYAKYIKPAFRPYYINRIGAFTYNVTGDAGKARAIFMEALKERQVPDTYYYMAHIAADQGDTAEAEHYWQLCVGTRETDPLIRIPDDGMGNLIQYYMYKTGQGDYREACRLSERIIEMKDSLAQAHHTETVAELQMKYDHERQQRMADRRQFGHLCVIAGLLAVIAALAAWMRFRANRSRKVIMQNQMLIEAYSRRISQMEQEGKDDARETERLRRRLDELQRQQAEMLTNGYRLYLHITQKQGTAALWSRSDFRDFVEYYRVIDLPFVYHLDTDYDGLSPKNKFFLILYNLGMTDADVQRVLGIGQSTIRTTFTRIRRKRIDIQPDGQQ